MDAQAVWPSLLLPHLPKGLFLPHSYLLRPAMWGLVVAAVQDDALGGDRGQGEEGPRFAVFPPLLPLLAVLRPPVLLLLLPLLVLVPPTVPPLSLDTEYFFRRGGDDVDSCSSRRAALRPLDAQPCETIALAADAPPFRVPLQQRLLPPLASEIMASPGGLVWCLPHSVFPPRRYYCCTQATLYLFPD